MKTTISLLLASSALCAAVGFPAMAGALSPGGDAVACGTSVCAMALADVDGTARLILVDDDGEEDDDDGFWVGGEDDEDGEDCDDEDDDDDDDDDDDEGYGEGDDDDGEEDDCVGSLGNPAPAGTVAPPANGLFGAGAPPVAVTN